MATWSLNSGFSLINNPSSVWSYGSKPTAHHVAGKFSLFTHLDSEPTGSGIVAWFGVDTVWNSHWLGVYYNTKSTENILKAPGSNTITFPANSVGMHPADDGRFSVARFTAPTNGNYSIDVTFTHIFNCAQNTGVYIVYNDLVTLWEMELSGPGNSRSFKSTDGGVAVKSNETIDFIVGTGLDRIFDCDMVLARADINLLGDSTKGIQTSIETQTSINKYQTNEYQTKVSVIAGSIGAILGLVVSTILFYVYYRYRKKQNINKNLQAIGSDHEVRN